MERNKMSRKEKIAALRRERNRLVCMAVKEDRARECGTTTGIDADAAWERGKVVSAQLRELLKSGT
jgi:hypothetical protein